MERVTQIINEWDPIGVFPMAPKDEYFIEIKKIYEFISTNRNLQVYPLARAINEIFVEAFGTEVYNEDLEICEVIAERMLKMLVDKRKIKEIYNNSFDLKSVPEKDRCGMYEWYDCVINKTYSELDLFDVTRMIIQKIYLEMALERAVEFMEEDPICGQRYPGELMELLLKVDMKYLLRYELRLRKILDNAKSKNREYEWMYEEERVEYEQIIYRMLNKILDVHDK